MERKIDWDKWDKLLGTMPDQKLADLIGCRVLAVAQRRKRLGVKSHQWQRIAAEAIQQTERKEAP